MAALRARIARSFRTSCLVFAGVVALSFGAPAQAAPQGRELAERVKAQDWNAARTLINLGVTYRAKSWTARLQVDNVTDKKYIFASGSRGGAIVGDPRNVKGSVTYSF